MLRVAALVLIVIALARPQTVIEEERSVSGIDICRVRRAGLTYLVDIHVEVDADLTVRRGHEIAHEVKNALLHSSLPVADVLVHIEPTSVSRALMPL